MGLASAVAAAVFAVASGSTVGLRSLHGSVEEGYPPYN